MKVPKEIADKVELYETLQKQANKLHGELEEYFENELDAEGFVEPFITDKPRGRLQNEDEYCYQIILGEDWFEGEHYYPVENSGKYVGYNFDI